MSVILEPEKGVSFEAVFKYYKGLGYDVKASNCMLNISVGQQVHEDAFFLTTIASINSCFRRCTIFVDDSLQRHTMSLCVDKSAKELYGEAIAEGDHWMDRNEKYYSTLTIPYNLIRWDEWLKHPKYNDCYAAIEALYDVDDAYREAFAVAAKKFIKRNGDRCQKSSLGEQRIFEVCIAYLKEECAAMCLWIEEDCHYSVYPSRRNEALEATYERIIKKDYPNLLIPVSIEFKEDKLLIL